MSRFYRPHRSPNWNYGGERFKLSRSKIDLYLDCARCFYIDNKLGVARPPGFPFALNSAVDHLFKKEFDAHRVEGSAHPLMEQYGVDAVPFAHADIDTWRDVFQGIQYLHEPTGFRVTGAPDDLWVNPDNELIVVDYKATSKDERIEALNKDWQDSYKRQMEVYQWLFQKNGFAVSSTGYFVYANGIKDREAFDGQLEFEVTLIPYTGDTSWVDEVLPEIHRCLEGDTIPEADPECDHCRYREAVHSVISV